MLHMIRVYRKKKNARGARSVRRGRRGDGAGEEKSRENNKTGAPIKYRVD